MINGRQLLPIERAVQMLTSEPAQLFGLRDRGVIREGARADLVLFDPARIGSEHATLVADLPGGTARLTAGAEGVQHVFVNGVETATDNASTGATPGTILRSGRDTATVATR
jgi:N-acyl-D-aspartate/D-glutamate deacylase